MTAVTRPAFSVKGYAELLMAKLLGLLPVAWVSAIGALLGELEVRYDARCKRIWVQRFYRNMETLMGASTAAQQKQCLINYGRQTGRVYAEYTVMHKLDRDGRIDIVGLENVSEQQRPVILVAPHMANWEVISKLAEHLRHPCCGLYEPRESNMRMYIANRARMAWASSISLVSTDSPLVLRQLTRKLKAGSNLLIMCDEERQGYVWAPSLGRQLPRAGNRWLAAKLAVQHGIDIVPLCVQRVDNVRFKLIVADRLLPPQEGDRQHKVQALADQIDHIFDTWVRDNPEHWFWHTALNLDKPFPPHLL